MWIDDSARTRKVNTLSSLNTANPYWLMVHSHTDQSSNLNIFVRLTCAWPLVRAWSKYYWHSKVRTTVECIRMWIPFWSAQKRISALFQWVTVIALMYHSCIQTVVSCPQLNHRLLCLWLCWCSFFNDVPIACNITLAVTFVCQRLRKFNCNIILAPM